MLRVESSMKNLALGRQAMSPKLAGRKFVAEHARWQRLPAPPSLQTRTSTNTRMHRQFRRDFCSPRGQIGVAQEAARDGGQCSRAGAAAKGVAAALEVREAGPLQPPDAAPAAHLRDSTNLDVDYE